jgi:hypothetical protein
VKTRKNMNKKEEVPKITITNIGDYLPTAEQILEFIEQKSTTSWPKYGFVCYLLSLGVMVGVTLLDTRVPIAAPLRFNFGVDSYSFYKLHASLGDANSLMFLSLFIQSFFASLFFTATFASWSYAVFTKYNFNPQFYYLLLASWVPDQIRNVLLMFLTMEPHRYENVVWFANVVNTLKITLLGLWLLCLVLSPILGKKVKMN